MRLLDFCYPGVHPLKSHQGVTVHCGAATDAGLAAYTERTKYRAVVYYMLTKKFGKESVYG